MQTRKKKLHRTKQFRKKNSRKSYKKNSRKIKGGFGKGSCPFVSPPAAWNANNYSYFFPLSKNGVATGGIPVYPGTVNDNKVKQKGGNIFRRITPQFFLNTTRLAETGLNNLVNRVKGKSLNPSPLPMYDQYKK